MQIIKPSLFCLGFLLVAAQACAENWPGSRGPTYQGVSKIPSYLLLDRSLYTINERGLVMCLDAATGDIVWEDRIPGNFAASPVTAGGQIYFVDDNGETTVIEAGSSFKVLAKNPLGEKTQASPAISRGQLFIRTEHHLYCIGEK